jgi:2-polyprenyl-3-methyl-5-hydroxy-6-metoxy-1,4-benzoquinol methylase
MDVLAQNRTLHEAQAHMERLPNYFDWVYGFYKDLIRGTVVELGCGAGLGLRVYRHQAVRIVAVDFNPELLRRIRAVYPGEQIETRSIDLIGDWNALREIRADVVILMDVLEHFKDDATLFRRAVDLLAPGGHVIAKVPAQQALYSDIDRASGHFRRYDRSDIEALLAAADVELRDLRQMNRLGALSYRLKRRSKTSFSRSFSTRQLQLINLLIPVLRRIDAALPGKGLSMVFAARKRPPDSAMTTRAPDSTFGSPAIQVHEGVGPPGLEPGTKGL